MAPSWNYTPLQPEEVRLLFLDPGGSSDDLSGSLVVTRHDPEQGVIPRYEALSYAWGDQADPDHIGLRLPDVKPKTRRPSDQGIVDDDEDDSSRPFAIRRNLSAALRQLRHDTDTRVLWCDSICINQQDLDERAAQVRRMGDIFKHAWRVIAWLGPADHQSHLAIRTLAELADYIDFSSDGEDYPVNQVRLKAATAEVFTDSERLLPLTQEQWGALEALISRSWFRRLWVRQEIVLAGRDAVAVVGGDSIPWMHLSTVFELIAIKRTKSVVKLSIHLAVDIYAVRTFSHMRLLRNFSSLVAFTYQCEVTDPRDLVYGLLGIASGSMTSKIPVDYTKDVKEVYCDALVQASTWHQDLTLLSFCDSASEPTWVPDLHRIRGMRALISGRAGTDSPSSARKLSKMHADARGVRCDAITEVVGPATEQEGATQDQLRALVVEVARRYLGPDPDAWSQDRLVQFCLTLLASESALTAPELDRSRALFASQVSPASRGSARAPPGDATAQLYPYIYYLQGRCLYLTRMGYLMLGPRGCQPGDVVVVLLGSNLPTVLRTIRRSGGGGDDDGGEYQIKGPACHPALFRGEALLGPLPEGWQVTNLNGLGRPIYNSPEGVQQYMDPRLGRLPPIEGWELRKRQDGSPFFYSAERDRWTNFDPRASEEELLKRGVPIQTFALT